MTRETGITRACSAISRLCCRALSAGLLVMMANPVAAELMLYPTRIVIEGNQRTAQIQLINNGTESTTYRLTLVNRRMSETGGFTEIDEPLPDEKFADEMLRFSPRQVTLAPGASQTVRMMVRKPSGLAEGEYRSHLLFSQQPQATGGNSIETRKDAKKIGVVITALIGASIPIIVRQGKPQAQVSITNLQLQRTPSQAAPSQTATPQTATPQTATSQTDEANAGQQTKAQANAIALTLERSGNRSVYGDIAVTFTPAGGAEQVIARANGVAVYAPNPLRRARLMLDSTQYKLAKGTLRVTFQEPAEAGGKLLAEAALLVP